MTPSSHVFFLNFIIARALCPPSLQQQQQQQQHDAIIARIFPQFHHRMCALSTIIAAAAA